MNPEGTFPLASLDGDASFTFVSVLISPEYPIEHCCSLVRGGSLAGANSRNDRRQRNRTNVPATSALAISAGAVAVPFYLDSHCD